MTDEIVGVSSVPIDETPADTTRRFWLRVTRDQLGGWRSVPLIVRQGRAPGPVVALTAVVHGNELNGLRTIQEVLASKAASSIDRGTLVAVPVVNLSGYRRHERAFADGKDLNRFVKPDDNGRPAQRFGFAFATTLLRRCDCLLDLHTAGGGRRNIFYARVDLDDEASAKMARCIAPPLIAHKPPRDNALRGFAAARGIPAAVLEIGDPGRFQPKLVADAVAGVLRLLSDLGMVSASPPPPGASIVCRDSYWVRANEGGTVSLSVRLADRVSKGEALGVIRDVWGEVRETIRARRKGVVIGLLRRPMVMEGSPIVHIGVAVE